MPAGSIVPRERCCHWSLGTFTNKGINAGKGAECTPGRECSEGAHCSWHSATVGSSCCGQGRSDTTVACAMPFGSIVVFTHFSVAFGLRNGVGAGTSGRVFL